MVLPLPLRPTIGDELAVGDGHRHAVHGRHRAVPRAERLRHVSDLEHGHSLRSTSAGRILPIIQAAAALARTATTTAAATPSRITPHPTCALMSVRWLRNGSGRAEQAAGAGV